LCDADAVMWPIALCLKMYEMSKHQRMIQRKTTIHARISYERIRFEEAKLVQNIFAVGMYIVL
jgi:hypothetical protein